MADEIQRLEGARRSVLVSSPAVRPTAPNAGYLLGKRLFDITTALLALPLLIAVALILWIANPIWNAGPLIYAQTRMGRGCVPFRAYKFRTMHPTGPVARGPDDPLETDRITPLGQFLRRTRLDELPQFLNVLLGEMSVIGPRPDYWDHALHYGATIPGYRQRYAMRPGITGLAQVSNGYAEGSQATVDKTRQDLKYIADACWATDIRIILRTARVLLTGFGAR